MRLERGKADYDVPDMSQVWSVVLMRNDPVMHPGEPIFPLRQGAIEDMLKARHDAQAFAKRGIEIDGLVWPYMFALNNRVSPMQMMFFPAPPCDLIARIEYFPPRKVM